MNQTIPEYSDSYSTIFQCTEGGFTCFLRFLEGLFSLVLLVFLIEGYKNMTAQSNNQISNEDKRIYFLAMAQTILLSLYYFLFEQFFVLATIRNLLIWITINILEVVCKMYWINNEQNLKILSYTIKLFAACNFLLWFVIAVSDGSEIVNTSFNLGYNCLIMDWIVLSGVLLIVSGLLCIAGFFKIDQIQFQIRNEEEKQKTIGNTGKNKNKESLETSKLNLTLFCLGSIGGALIMFIWDFTAYMTAQDDQSCVQIFSGNTLFRKILCFLLKLFSMQLVPLIIYYITYYQKKEQFLSYHTQEHNIMDDDFLRDDAASQLNRSLSGRNDSRRSLFSSSSIQNL